MTIRTMLDATVQKIPDAIAMRFRRNGSWTSRTYHEFNIRIRQAAEVAGRLSITPGRDNVGLLLENCPEWMEIYAALAGAGVTVVPIDPKLRPQEIAFILGDAEAVALFANGRHCASLEEILPRLPRLQNLVFLDGSEAARTPCAGRTSQDYETAVGGAASDAAAAGAWFDQSGALRSTRCKNGDILIGAEEVLCAKMLVYRIPGEKVE